MVTLIFLIIAFFSGAIPFSIIFTKILSGKDVREVGDNNPGAVNAWKTGGALIGMSVMFVEFLKAILPIWLAYQYFDISGYDLVLVSAMPILGHSFSPFLKFKGGKALAVTAAMWLALFNVESALIIFGLLAIMYTIQKNDAWTVNIVHLGFFIYGMTTNISNEHISNSQFMFLWIFASLVMVYNHRKELQSPPNFKRVKDLFGVKYD
ncbi:MAG: hypothetical protein CL761_05140 [Chloroflexi bacterium]|nr:hypothetical protein [Chloroflexota bacterium]MCH2672958.1 glycerol-3-phosphate acyltransferase [Dehalococcoidia bacterium]|tara:strand:+ start:51 stop:674 length:624 start_codon:yes stop_codon:yes gene_type:complete